MKKLYKIIPFILIFVMMFSIPVYATESKNETPLYECTVYDSWYMELINVCIEQYYSDTGNENEIFVYAVTLAVDSDTLHRANVYIGSRTSAPGGSNDPTLFSCTGSIRNYKITQSSGGAVNLYESSVVDSVSLATNGNVKYQVIYVSQDIYDDLGTLYYQSPNPLYPEIEEEDKTAPNINYDFIEYLEEFETYVDYSEFSQNYNDTVVSSKQDILENENNPNDSVFADILSAMTGATHVNNQIVQQISAQINQFAEGVFKPFANYCLNYLMNIENAVVGLGGMFEEFSDFMNKMYSLGLDDSGFSLDSFFLNLATLLFVPEDGYIENKIETFYFEKFGFIELGYSFLDSVKSALNQTGTVMPVITTDTYTWNDIVIPSFTIDFSWYELFKPYVDPVVSAFCWVVFVWKVIVGIPSLIRGNSSLGSSFVEFKDEFQHEQYVKRETELRNEKLNAFSKYNWF